MTVAPVTVAGTVAAYVIVNTRELPWLPVLPPLPIGLQNILRLYIGNDGYYGYEGSGTVASRTPTTPSVRERRAAPC